MAALAWSPRSGPSLDEIDLALLREVRRDGRVTHEELSRRVALSRPAVVQRMKRLQDIGAILGFTATFNWDLLGLPILAFVRVRTSGRCREAAQQLMRMSDESLLVEECHRTTGEWCLLLKVRAASSLAIEAFLDRIRDDAGVVATMTTLATSTIYSAT
ncbi:MAG TPA: Lrp/AsnC family transcriptional regulator [Candidatus Baltobacteraceae bacterium]|jgi:Lrp/AsnC family leucine-responsive transcriptional regulator|nr:Lrp/AsnC family transcriptional regulator [Candidatus Baltobacteraceae bacterium]